MTRTEPKLTSLAHGGGCGCKIAPDVLQAILADTPHATPFAALMVGRETSDDAAVWRLNDSQALVATTDFFMPMVDDPFDFGRIAATNALSDVYAMGATPIFALAIVGMPIGQLSVGTIGKVLEGGASVCAAAGIPIAGGHSIDSVEPIYGLVALGLVHPDKVLANRTAKAGDVLILTKPLGVGVLSAAFKQGRLDDPGYEALIASATRLNTLGARLPEIKGVHAVTDVTGFGLLGHALEMARGSGLAIEVDADAPAFLPSSMALAEAGVRTGASTRNWTAYGDAVTLPDGLPAWRRDLLTDPQTSGGLLISVAPDQADAVLALASELGFASARPVGRVIEGRAGVTVTLRPVIRQTSDLSLAARQGYDAIIDVRSPAEFAADHIPGAINLPVLDDAQRAEVGTMFVQSSKFLARRTGAAYVARNIAGHLQTALADRDGSFRPLVYCWRGGQRSAAMVTVMEQVGWPVTRLEGGYQTWRRQVVADLYGDAPAGEAALNIILLDGYTGSGKTGILRRLQDEGVQVIDLEALADHRGSLFGATPVPQPGQKLFETRIAEALARMDRTLPVVVEAESSRIGNRTIPPVLWAAMKAAVRIEVAVPLEARVAHILSEYQAIGEDVTALETALAQLPRHHSKKTVAGWVSAARQGRLAELVTDLMLQHYDPAYRRGSDASPPAAATIALDRMSEGDLRAAAQRIALTVARVGGSSAEAN